ncbi:MAG: TIGR03619 family F420-dependent LLM class oxidoreductase [Streptosporangiaceae bacterium]
MTFTTNIRFGAKVDNYGPAMVSLGLAGPAARAEAAGFSSLWLSDHVVMPSRTRSRFPFTEDGNIYWDPRDPWYEPVVCLPVLAGATETAEVGVGVLLAALRHPVLLAKQLASIDAMSAGRLLLGVGSGWMAEEFAALGVPFEDRGQRLDELITVLRLCWTGQPGAFSGHFYHVPADMFCYPVPTRPVPVIVGGMSAPALRRAAVLGDGWLALPKPSDDPLAVVRDAMTYVRETATAGGRDLSGWRCILNAHEPHLIAPLLPQLLDQGVTDVLVDLDYADPDGPATAFEMLSAAAR